MLRNVKYGWRTLARTPIFFSMAVLTLALGVGATTAVFSLFYQVLLRALPVAKPEQMVVLHTGRLPGRSSSDNFESVFSYPMYVSLRDGSGTLLQGLIARASTSVDVLAAGETSRATAETVSGNFFAVLGLRAFAGRL